MSAGEAELRLTQFSANAIVDKAIPPRRGLAAKFWTDVGCAGALVVLEVLPGTQPHANARVLRKEFAKINL